jgi:hypothetical protein
MKSRQTHYRTPIIMVSRGSIRFEQGRARNHLSTIYIDLQSCIYYIH